MVRKYKKMALYEALSKLGPKSSQSKALEQLHPEKQPATEHSNRPAGYSIGKRDTNPNRPRAVQLNMGRIEISLPYPIVIAIVLVIVLMFLVTFRLGQLAYEKGITQPSASADSGEKIRFVAGTPTASEVLPEIKITEAVVDNVERNNWIVIQTLKTSTPLVPVKTYFAGHGIETEVRKIGDRFYLLTKEKYENPMNPGTDGYAARMRIIELGASYVSPPGHDSFGTKPFYDAYGMKSRD